MALIGDYANANRRGRLLGLTNTVGDLGSAAGPLLAYALLPLIGLRGVFLLMAAIVAVVAPLALRSILAEGRTSLAGPPAPEPGYH